MDIFIHSVFCLAAVSYPFQSEFQ